MSPETAGAGLPTWSRIRAGTASPASRLIRERVIDSIRSFFKTRGFHEVETPLFVRHPGMEPYLDVFETTWRTALGESHAGFLTTSPEYAMKKLLAAGLGPIFQVCKSFRNGEEVSARHNPEFTILEWYRPEAGYEEIMDDCEGLFRETAVKIDPAFAGTWRYQGQEVDLASRWERLSVADAFSRYADVDLTSGEPSLVDASRAKGYTLTSGTTWEQAFHLILLNEVEPRLGRERPTILYEYPIALAALARPKPGDPRFAERFELYIAGIEMANAFSELTDPVEQLLRLRSEQDERRRLGKTSYDIDQDFINALVAGIPRSAGIALGVDRMAVFFADVTSIRDVLWFPADELFS